MKSFKQKFSMNNLEEQFEEDMQEAILEGKAANCDFESQKKYEESIKNEPYLDCEEIAQPISEDEFCAIHSSFYGCNVDSIEQLVFTSFKGNELREYVNYFVSHFIKKTTTLNKNHK